MSVETRSLWLRPHSLVEMYKLVLSRSLTLCCLGRSADSTIKLLRNTGWNTDAAVNEFLDNPGPYSPEVDQAKIEEIFTQYKGRDKTTLFISRVPDREF